jgi:hypothetical protein
MGADVLSQYLATEGIVACRKYVLPLNDNSIPAEEPNENDDFFATPIRIDNTSPIKVRT